MLGVRYRRSVFFRMLGIVYCTLERFIIIGVGVARLLDQY